MPSGNEYNVDFPISYMGYCEQNGIEDASDEVINKFANDVLTGLQTTSPVDDIIRFFGIQDEDKTAITDKNYDVSVVIKNNDIEHKTLTLYITLMIGK